MCHTSRARASSVAIVPVTLPWAHMVPHAGCEAGSLALELDTSAHLADYLSTYHADTPCWDRGNSTRTSIFPSRAYSLLLPSIGVVHGSGTSRRSGESSLYRQTR